MSETTSTLLERLTELTATRNQAAETQREATEALATTNDGLLEFLLKNEGAILPFKGKARCRMVKTGEGWRAHDGEFLIPAGDYYVGQCNKASATDWLVHLTRPEMQDYESIVAMVGDIDVATPEEVGEVLRLREEVIASALGSPALERAAFVPSGVRSRTPF